MRTPLNRYLSTVGDGTGTKNGNINGSAGGVNGTTDLLLKPGATEAFCITGLTIKVMDTGALLPQGYGALSALSSGVGLYLRTQQGELDLMGGIPATRHYDWMTLPYSARPIDTTPIGQTSSNFFIAHLTFKEPILLSGKYANPDALIVRLPAVDLSGLDEHYFKATGFYVGQP